MREQNAVCPRGLPGPVCDVIDALHGNQQQLHRNLQAAAARLPLALPFAHAAAGLAKVLPQDVPAALAAAAARLGGVAAAAAPPGSQVQQQQQQKQKKQQKQQRQADSGEVVCIEYTKGKRRVYRQRKGTAGEGASDGSAGSPSSSSSSSAGGGEFEIADDAVQHRQRLSDLAADYLLPQGYPDSVAPQYEAYMRARAWQYLFGGALSVFTTRSLLASLGVANRASGEAAAAINWAVKDGAGRLGRFLFARWGRDLDCELKQFRLAGDFLMEAGAALELSTAMVPTFFLPLACTANLAKNLAAVAIVSTRAPIYRTFALRNNLADVTAKGESVANLADVVGTALGIALTKTSLPVGPTFAVLSAGYIIASRREVDTVILPYLNRARLSYAARAFCSTGAVPGLEEGNKQEPIMPWSDPHNGRVVLGATVEEACSGPQHLQEALASFPGRQYALTYRPDTRKCYALLKQGASLQSILQAALDAHCLLWMLDNKQQQVQGLVGAAPAVGAAPGGPGKAQQRGRNNSRSSGGSNSVVDKMHAASRQLGSSGGTSGSSSGSGGGGPSAVGQEALAYVARSDHFREFQRQAQQCGWRMDMTSLNPRETRLML